MSSSPGSHSSRRIALLLLHAERSRGGAERYTADLAAALIRHGHDVTTIAATTGGDATVDGHDWPGEVVTVTRGSHTHAGLYERYLAGVERHLLGHKYDVVHAMLPVSAADVYQPHAGLAAQVLTEGHRQHGRAWRRGLAYVANRTLGRRARAAAVERSLLTGSRPPAVICLSDAMRQTVRRFYPIGPTRLETVFNAVDLDRFDPALPTALTRKSLGVGEDEPVVLTVAQDFARKGVPQAIKAVHRLRSEDAVAGGKPVLVVVGKPTGRWPNDPAYRIVGDVDDPRPYYAVADLFVLPSRQDPCSLVVLEALAMGLPVVSTRVNGATEIMTDGVHGSVLNDPDDVPALAAAIARWLNPAAHAATRGACETLRVRLSFAEHVRRVEEVYALAMHHSRVQTRVGVRAK